MEILRQDLRYAVRTLMRSPGFTLVAVLSLGLAVLGLHDVFAYTVVLACLVPARRATRVDPAIALRCE